MKWFSLAIPTLIAVCFPASGGAWEITGFSSLGAGQVTYPADAPRYSKREEFPWLGNFRLLVENGDGLLHFTTNVLEELGAQSSQGANVGRSLQKEVERSNILTWEQFDSAESRGILSADVMVLQYRSSGLDVSIGRQSVSLATTFYFSPNDFFAPFAPQSFFRTYRPGVDGLRADIRLESLTQLRLLAVLAYGKDAESANGWSSAPDWSRTSLMAGYNREWHGFGWSLLGGTVADHTILGGGLQGELFGWLGVRAEGHYSATEQDGSAAGGRFALGVEHRYVSGLDWRLEYFHNGYFEMDMPSPGRHYVALGVGYQLTPLSNGGLVILANLNDGSQFISANILYSVSDEAEMVLTVGVPRGSKPFAEELGSEYGRQPRQVLVEYRVYF